MFIKYISNIFTSTSININKIGIRGSFEVYITVFDTKKDKRLLIDGLHRAAALTMACEENKSISKIVIYECYGERVDIIFLCYT